ncbi:hypothetical protein Tco_1445469, partial [Tanacetum coccineum]
YQEFHKIIKDEIAPIVSQVDARVQNFENHFVKEAAKFVRDFISLAKKADKSLDKISVLEKENEHLLRAVASQDIMSIVQNHIFVETSDLQTELEQGKYDKISYDKAYNNMKHQIERLQAQLGDLKGKSMDTHCAFDTLDPLSQKLEDENLSLEFQILNYAKENAHLKTTYKNLFDSINPNAFQSELPKSSKIRVPPKVVKSNDLSNPVTSNSVPTTKKSKVVKNNKVIAPRMFRINPFKTYREDKFVPIKKIRASVKTKPITVSQPHVITKEYVNYDSNGLSSTGVDNTAKTRRPQPRSNTKNDLVPSASKSSCIKNKEVEVEEQHRNLLLSKN